jgi:hypothetical protein
MIICNGQPLQSAGVTEMSREHLSRGAAAWQGLAAFVHECHPARAVRMRTGVTELRSELVVGPAHANAGDRCATVELHRRGDSVVRPVRGGIDMSRAEIADNKWEVEASKPPIFTAGGLAHVMFFVGFVAVFGYIFANSVVAIVTPKQENSLGEMYKNLKQDDSAPPATKPGE